MPRDTMVVVKPRESRQAMIEALDLGESVSISRRIELEAGLSQEAMQDLTHMLRASLDQQTGRARRNRRDVQYTVENGAFITRSGALVLTAVCTRIL